MPIMKNKNTPKLKYHYDDQPHGYVGVDHLWGQDLNFNIELAYPTKKELLQKRAALVRDVAKLFEKYGVPTEDFNCQNEWI